ncbi:MAG TPA: 4-hydroxy-tetrahydrodipicolinate reductase [Gammaproteobacteria bacterium]|nr:4-hydroxy-tetrahydrodipicolinate reductase [Gammaproteobacteria bacterium]
MSERQPIRVALLGASGRMGQAVLEAASGMDGLRVVAALVGRGSTSIDKTSHGLAYSTDLTAALTGADVLVDFSLPESTGLALDACLAARKPLVTGVTGIDAALKGRLADAGKHIPVLAAPNMSLGVALLSRMVEQAAKVLGPDFDIEISEAHHRHKKDAPSGTALALAEVMSQARGQPAPVPGTDRRGTREPGSIGFSVVRAGDIVGEHTVLFAGTGERLELSHRAQSRATFAHGALRAARWIVGKPAGLYRLSDTLQA